ncbi:UDP-N-acetylmuramoyl-L-alanyl-D-glutamate--2,6-diaminopimelate ligase [Litchfieldella qijiaojingensis]|uniref:UDP-N-acetylmuramoyl-L-alanyl-D-glutamate--2,6-diaminopimelate ligase n=1 Tax=Litchfieldella qijiaojingensis TaxID=980347 RepID=A0ABQ2YF33_9GAMM|nr:UDP-N-acetylmuramoyl-L-alanyl-D-glutamate--2,6-diaminopimelate ligase [Halomonas qijiaojingensis]GGX81648.1 UDP-N-acetylmuramoyl-L-alanyl-D-glutamate--2,6-diaminopimelate ligase [Halomonas qijiaojingensis]
MQVECQQLIESLERLWPGVTATWPATVEGSLRLVLDSRELGPGDVFVAVPGVRADGRDHIVQALAAGAALVLCHHDDDATVAGAEDPRVLLLPGLKMLQGELGRSLFEVPDELEVIGVTGTNGKSSVTHYIAALSEALGKPCGLVGTLGYGRPGQLREGGLTTPGPLALQAYLGKMAAGGITRVAMEVSSHALEQQRLEGCRLRAGVFTNLSRDHLDYHGSMAAYAAAKAQLFKRAELELAVVNADDSLARLMLAGLGAGVRVLATGQDEVTTLRVLEWLPHESGQRALIAGPDGEFVLDLPLMGRFNLDNVLLAMAVLHGLGESLDALSLAAGKLSPVPGRMQLLTRPGMPSVVVDYAHTPDALDNALQGLRAHLGTRNDRGCLWCLFGCGGERDTGKRPLMGQIAETRAERLVITDDNPRHESAEAIRLQILEGLTAEGRQAAWEVAGRQAAIEWTIAEAAPEDVILIAGKGHEPYQEIAGIRHPFSDVAIAEAALGHREARA